MEPNVRIAVAPTTAGRVTAIHDGDSRVRMREERVGKCHSRGAGTHDEIVSLELFVHPGGTLRRSHRG
jgi:hypothetical protein